MTKKIEDYKKERGKLIDSIQVKSKDIKKTKSELKNKKSTVVDSKKMTDNIYFNQKMIKELESLNDFDSYDIQKLELIKKEVVN